MGRDLAPLLQTEKRFRISLDFTTQQMIDEGGKTKGRHFDQSLRPPAATPFGLVK